MQNPSPVDPTHVLLTVSDLAARRKQKPKTIHNKLSSGTLGIPVIRLNGTEPRFRLSDVIADEQKWEAPS